MTEDTDDLSPQEEEELNELLKSYGSPVAEEKHNVHTFLTAIARSKDTIKTGNLLKEEVGDPTHPVRSLKECEIISATLCNDSELEGIFRKEAEILTSTSLSKDGFLINRSVMQRKEITDPLNKPSKPNKGWFSKKDKPSEEQSTF